MADGEVPGFFKVWGSGDDVWVVGAGGTVLHRKGTAPFTVVPTGVEGHALHRAAGPAIGCSRSAAASNGVLLELAGKAPPACATSRRQRQGSSRASSPTIATATGRAESGASSTRGKGNDAFAAVDHGFAAADRVVAPLDLRRRVRGRLVGRRQRAHARARRRDAPSLRRRRSRRSLTSTRTTPAPDAGAAPWRALRRSSPPARADRSRDAGTSRSSRRSASTSRGPRCTRATCSTSRPRCGTRGPHTTPTAKGVFVRERHTAADVDEARRAAISYAAYDVLAHRYEHADRRQEDARVPARGHGRPRLRPGRRARHRRRSRSPSATASVTRSSQGRRPTARTKPTTTPTPTGYQAAQPAARVTTTPAPR